MVLYAWMPSRPFPRLAGGAGQEKQVRALAPVQWIPGRDQRWGARRRRSLQANVDVMMAIDALELSIEMRPDVVILVTGDADFAYLAIKLRRHGIRVEVASVAANLGNMLRSPRTT